jgi:MFS family permease
MNVGVLRKDGFYGWIALAGAALFFCASSGVFMNSVGVFLPSICKDFGRSRGAVSVAATLLMMVMSLSSPLAGWFVGKHGARMAVILGNVLGASGLLWLSFHSDLWELYAAYGALIGLGIGVGGMIPGVTIASNWFVRKAPLAIGIVLTAGGVGGMVLLPAMMAMIRNIGWRETYLVLCGIVLVFGVIIPGIMIRNKPEDLGQAPDGVASLGPDKNASHRKAGHYVTAVDFTLKEALSTRVFWLLVIYVTGSMFLVTMIMPHQIAFLLDIGIGPGAASLALGLIAGIGTIGRLGAGFLGLKLDLQKVSLVAVVFMLIGTVLILVTSLSVKSLPMVFAYGIFFGVGFGGSMVAGMSITPAYFGRTHYSKIVGITVVFSIVGTMGAPIAGAIHDATRSYVLAFALAVAVGIICLVTMIMVRPPLHPSLRVNSD